MTRMQLGGMMSESELRIKYRDLIPVSAEIEVRDKWLPLIDEYFSGVKEIYGDSRPSVTQYVVYEDQGLVIDCDDTPWSGNQDADLKRRVRELAADIQLRSRDVV
ncbi:hypothetical protein HFO98_10360 [Rhizobium leguminosarum]|uniref:hypothetical protein n=1 Tax=Rhizobium leguminosarum TaxID=384 RepID=UPI001C978AF4|nr:hypothetical protein [Rhizobium leguminosarum]MBY5408872.1 hypothetical protein [Rhizobium leguminosarum]